MEHLFPERCLHRRMAHRLGMRPGTVQTGKITGPEEVPYTHLRHAPKPALFLDREREEDLTLHEPRGLVRQQDVGLKDPGGAPAPVVATVDAPAQKPHPVTAAT